MHWTTCRRPFLALLTVVIFWPQGAPAQQPVRTPAEAAYRKFCGFCHDDGTIGAPRTGDREAWAPRLAKGVDELGRNAWNGYAHMPPRREREDLTEDNFLLALEYMIRLSR